MDSCGLGPTARYCEHSSEIISIQCHQVTVRYPVVLRDKTDKTKETQPQLSLDDVFFFCLTCYMFRLFHKAIISHKDRQCTEVKAFANGITASLKTQISGVLTRNFLRVKILCPFNKSLISWLVLVLL